MRDECDRASAARPPSAAPVQCWRRGAQGLGAGFAALCAGCRYSPPLAVRAEGGPARPDLVPEHAAAGCLVQIVFIRDIRPILTNTCYRATRAISPKAISADQRETALKGGMREWTSSQARARRAAHPFTSSLSRIWRNAAGRGKGPADPGANRAAAGVDRPGGNWEQTEPEIKTAITVRDRRLETVKGRREEIPRALIGSGGWNGRGEFRIREQAHAGLDSHHGRSRAVMND